MMAAFAELERDILQERTLAGLRAARARRAKGESPTQIATALGVSRASVYRHLAAAEQAGMKRGATWV